MRLITCPRIVVSGIKILDLKANAVNVSQSKKTRTLLFEYVPRQKLEEESTINSLHINKQLRATTSVLNARRSRMAKIHLL